jgi:hypothetical protein
VDTITKWVYLECDRCGQRCRMYAAKADRLRRMFGSVWCPDCQLVTSIWTRRGGLVADLPVDVEVVLLHAGEAIGPPL